MWGTVEIFCIFPSIFHDTTVYFFTYTRNYTENFNNIMTGIVSEVIYKYCDVALSCPLPY